MMYTNLKKTFYFYVLLLFGVCTVIHSANDLPESDIKLHKKQTSVTQCHRGCCDFEKEDLEPCDIKPAINTTKESPFPPFRSVHLKPTFDLPECEMSPAETKGIAYTSNDPRKPSDEYFRYQEYLRRKATDKQETKPENIGDDT